VSRPTPFDLAFADLADRFEEIRAEAGEAGADPGDRARFAKLPTVQRLLADVAAPELVERRPEAADEYLTTLFVAFHFCVAGRRVLAVPRDRLEGALGAPAATSPPRESVACYLQLPERWFWAQVDPETAHEPLDGMFVVGPGPGGEVTVLAVLGLRSERAGFSQLAVRATPSELRRAPAEVRRPPFAPVLAGGQAAGLRSVVSVSELLHLAQLALALATE
jgi:hypothetical protein